MSQISLQQSPSKLSPTDRRPKTSADSKTSFFKRRSHLNDVKRDSGLAPSFVTASKDSTADASPAGEPQPRIVSQELSNVPSIALNDQVQDHPHSIVSQPQRPHTAPGNSSSDPIRPAHTDSRTAASPSPDAFEPLKTSIETGDFDDPFSSNQLSFSKRGSILLDGQSSSGSFMASRSPGKSPKDSPNTMSPHAQTSSLAPQRTLSISEQRLSQQIRSLYEDDEDHHGLGIVPEQSFSEREENGVESDVAKDTLTVPFRPSHTSPSENRNDLTPPLQAADNTSNQNAKSGATRLEPWEAAGGLENWRDVNSADVDRYGFIRKPSKLSTSGSPERRARNRGTSNSLSSPEESSKKQRKLQRPPPDSSRSHRLSATSKNTKSPSSSRPPSRAPSRVSVAASSAISTRSRRSLNPFRSTPNKNRRWADEAPAMLVSPPQIPATPSADPTVKTERQRVEKWRKMAAPVKTHPAGKKANLGGGQLYTFDTASPKLHARVWKGIPEVWRAQAWHAFLTPRDPAAELDATLIARYRTHKDAHCRDDQQIHLDVPRTAGDHVLFRVERRGGQRLLFYVLRALALEFPATGYTQGMASVAATLLTYFPEEEAFVCAYRLWRDRGLAELFAPGFENLRTTVGVFEQAWLGANPARARLEALGVDAMLYGMRWYLTLFNYAMPFEAQMRVWDVFMLLGGRRQDRGHATDTADDGRFDVLHAVAAALIDGLADVLAEGEYETAMASLTRTVDVQNADVLMTVARKEFEARQERRKG